MDKLGDWVEAAAAAAAAVAVSEGDGGADSSSLLLINVMVSPLSAMLSCTTMGGVCFTCVRGR